MITKLTYTIKKIGILLIASILLATMSPANKAAFAAVMPVDELSDYYSQNEVLYYDRTACGGGVTDAATSLGNIDKFLQVLAHQESGGILGKTSPTGAKGKYQYIDSTWRGVIRGNKLPWTQYRTANEAPESVQDAVAFIEYSIKFKRLNNDIFKLAVSHFYPAANDNPKLLDVIPPGNKITPRQYAKSIENKVATEGPWSKIPLKYKEAPGFAEAAKAHNINPDEGGGTIIAGNLKYISVGNIPASGKTVGASTYGGEWDGSRWLATNDVERPGSKNDDTGIGNRNNKLPGTTAYAELSLRYGTGDYSALGKLKDGTKLAITYNGRTVIAQKGDVGNGQKDPEGSPFQKKIEGHRLAIDLFYDVARLLDFKNGNGVVNIRGVDPSTAVTPTGGTALTDGSDKAGDVNCTNPCDQNTTGDIVLDPGHSTPDKQGEEDAETHLKVGDNSGAPGERQKMQETANKVKANLERDGYKVILTKSKADEYVDLRKRAEIANKSGAALAVSLHYDGGHSANNWGEIYAQEVGLSRYNGTPEHRVNEKKFTDAAVAAKSKDYAQKFKLQRQKVEGFKSSVKHANFSARGPNYSLGDIPMVQLFSKVPWVYNEIGGKNFDVDKYALSITRSIKEAVKPSGAGAAAAAGGTAAACDEAANGSVVQTAINYAWPTRDEGLSKGPRELDRQKGYSKAIDQFHLYRKDGRDCGEFVAAVMIGSGADKNYPKSFTPTQESYVRKNKKYRIVNEVRSSSDLVPGMILIVNAGSGAGSSGHTRIWIGKQKNGTNEASASLGSRTGSRSFFTPGPDELGRGFYTGAILR